LEEDLEELRQVFNIPFIPEREPTHTARFRTTRAEEPNMGTATTTLLPTEFPVDLPSKGHCYDSTGEFLHIFKNLPGIPLSVLQQHLVPFLDGFGYPEFPYQVAQHQEYLSGFVITVHTTHLIAQDIAKEECHLKFLKRTQNGNLSYQEALTTHGTLEEVLEDLRQEYNIPFTTSEPTPTARTRTTPRVEVSKLVTVVTNLQHMMNQIRSLAPPPGAKPSNKKVASSLDCLCHQHCLPAEEI
jgi:hypothetical protein